MPVNVPRVPPVTVTSESVKSLAFSLRLKVNTAVSPLFKELLEEVMAMVGVVMSTLKERV